MNGYVKAVLPLEAVRRKREHRYERVVRPRDELAVEVAMITQATARDGTANRG